MQDQIPGIPEARTTVRKLIMIKDRAKEGEPSIETLVITEAVEEGMQETTIEKSCVCGSCGKALHNTADVYALCTCGNVLCPDPQCSSVKCTKEDCLKIICPGCRAHPFFSDRVLCPVHAREENVHFIIKLVIFALVVLALILLVPHLL